MSAAFRALSLPLALAVLAGAPARAQDDQPIPYASPPGSPTPGPTSTPSAPPDNGPLNRDEHDATVDDSAVGIGAEGVGGLLLLDSARGAFAEPRWTAGGRVSWDYGRLLDDPTLHEGLFVDLTYLYAYLQDGTQAVNVLTNIHDLTLAPAFELPFGEGSAYGAYVQLGAGIAYQAERITSGNVRTAQAINPLFQYGIGVRGRPLLSEDGTLRLTFRLELTRFRRAYMNDTLVLGSLGLAY